MEAPAHIASTEHTHLTGPSFDKEKMQDKNNQGSERPVEISFTSEEMLLLEQEIDRLEGIAVICRVVGSRPNRGLLRDMLQGKYHAQVGGIKEVQLLGKGFYQIVLEDKVAAEKLITLSPCQIRNTWLFMRKWTHGFNPEKAAHHDDAMKKVTMLFPGLSLEYSRLLPTIGNSFGMMLDEDLTLADRLKKQLGPPSIRLLVPDIDKLPSKVLIPGKNGMRIEQRIEVIGAPGQCFACKKFGHLKKNCPTRGTKEPAKEVQDDHGTKDHEKPPPPRPNKAVREWRVVGKTHVLRKTPQSQHLSSPVSSNRFDLLQELPPTDEYSPSSFLTPQERPKVTPNTQEKILVKAYKTGKRRRISHVKTLMRSLNGIAPNGKSTNQGSTVNITPQIIALPDISECASSSQDLEPHPLNALKWLGIGHTTVEKIRVHVSAVHKNGVPTTSISFPLLLTAQEDWSKAEIRDTLCKQAACFVTKIRDDVLMNELKKHWNNTEFWCTMDEEEPHLCHIHLRTIIDTQLTPSFFYFYEKQEGTIKAHRVAHNLHSWIWTNIPSLEMIGCLNGECSPLTACCAKHQEQLAISHPIP